MCVHADLRCFISILQYVVIVVDVPWAGGSSKNNERLNYVKQSSSQRSSVKQSSNQHRTQTINNPSTPRGKEGWSEGWGPCVQ